MASLISELLNLTFGVTSKSKGRALGGKNSSENQCEGVVGGRSLRRPPHRMDFTA